MAATKDDLRRWFQIGSTAGESYMIVACDTMDYSDYPIYASTTDHAQDLVDMIQRHGNRIMEVYDLHIDMEYQMAERRAWHL